MPKIPRRLRAVLGRGMTRTAQAVQRVGRGLSRPAPAIVLLVLFMAKFFIDGEVAIDFGAHWDEWYHVSGLLSCVRRMSLMPDSLSYGGPYFTLGYPVMLAHLWRNLLPVLHEFKTQSGYADPMAFASVQDLKTAANGLLGTGMYVLQIRGLFLAVTGLSILWTFLASLRMWPRRYGAALAGAAFMAFSWEFGYHARWIAIDTPLTQFAALELFLFCGTWCALTEVAVWRWFCLAAAASGAVFACKLTGGFAYLPILVTPFTLRGIRRVRTRFLMAVVGAALFFVTSFALSPEFYVDPLHFLHVIRSGTADYNSVGPGYPFYVGVTEHLLRLQGWLFVSFPSPFHPIAVVFSMLTVVGLVVLLRRHTRMTLTWMIYLVSFIAVFTHNHLLIVRQYLMCTPLFALCFAAGASWVWDRLQARDQRLGAALTLLLAAGFTANGVFESVQAWHVVTDTQESIDVEASHDLLSHPAPVRMSQPVFDRMRPRIGDAYTCKLADVKDKRIHHFIAYQTEHGWLTNRIDSFRKVYGAHEVNMDYYSSWSGKTLSFRFVDVSMDVVTALGRSMVNDIDCFPTGKKGPPAANRGAGGAGPH